MSTLANTLYSLGHWLIEQQRGLDAVHVFRTMLVNAPSDERSWVGLGQAHECIGHHDAALALYELGESSVVTSFRCSLARARLLRRLGKEGAADDAFERAVERAREHEESVAHAIAFERLAA